MFKSAWCRASARRQIYIADRNSNCDTYEYDIYAWNGVHLLAVEDLHKLIQVPHFNVFLIMQMV